MATIDLSNDPRYLKAFTSAVHPNVSIYTPADSTDYHMSRYVAAGAQEIYSSCGATKELTGKMYAEMKRICDESHQSKSLKGYMDLNTLLDNLLYRHAYPVDELCALRMGAILSFLGDEDPDSIYDAFTRRKVALALGDPNTNTPGDPELYAFFLTLGVVHTPAYTGLLDTLIASDYLERREVALRSLTPQPQPTA